MKRQQENAPRIRPFGGLLVLAGALLAGGWHGDAANAADEPIMGIVDPGDGWNQIGILDLREFPWDKVGRFQSKSKTFFKTPADGGFIYSVFSPTWDVTPP